MSAAEIPSYSDNPLNPAEPTIPPAAPYRPPADEEIVFFDGNPLLRSYIGQILLGILIGAACIGFAIVGEYQHLEWWPGWWLTALLCAAGVLMVIIPYSLTKTTRYRITNYRIDYERGIANKRIDTLELWHVEDISFSQNLLDRLFGVSTITVLSHDDTTPKFNLEGIPGGRKVFEELKQRIIAIKRQRGVIIMDTGQ